MKHSPINKKTRAEAPVKALDPAGETGRSSEGERVGIPDVAQFSFHTSLNIERNPHGTSQSDISHRASRQHDARHRDACLYRRGAPAIHGHPAVWPGHNEQPARAGVWPNSTVAGAFAVSRKTFTGDEMVVISITATESSTCSSAPQERVSVFISGGLLLVAVAGIKGLRMGDAQVHQARFRDALVAPL